MFIISLLLLFAFTSNLENLSSICAFSISVFFISTSTMGTFVFSTAFKNAINTPGCSSEPNIFLNTKSILGFNNVLCIIYLPLLLIILSQILYYIF